MDLSLSDFELVESFCELYNLSHYDSDYQAWASSIRYVYTEFSIDKQRSYVKGMRWSMSKKHNRQYFFERITNRLFLNKRTDQFDYFDLSELQAKVKIKHGMEHCNQPCYSMITLLRSVTCECCASSYYIGQWYNTSELGRSVCSTECSSIARLCAKLNYKYSKKLISRRFYMARGDSNLHRFLSYFASQQTIKRKKKNKGKFTWS